MVYAILKISARLALKIYCGEIFLQDKKVFKKPGPLLFASNHPNSFLDALIIAAHTKNKTYILVRGDVFKNKWGRLFLRYLGCIPIYRGQDGRSMLGQNTLSFQECLAVFEAGNHVLIFCEGNCENEWKLRPLGKGTARLAMTSWQSQTRASTLQVIPTGFTYSHFNGMGKHVITLTGHPMAAPSPTASEQKKLVAFNQVLREELKPLILQFSGDPEKIKICGHIIESISVPKKIITRDLLGQLQQTLDATAKKEIAVFKQRSAYSWKTMLISPFALAGWLLHAPFYYPIMRLAKQKTKNTVYYDSVLFGALFLLYPVYVIMLATLLIVLTKNTWCGLIIVAAPWLALLTVKSSLFKRA